jgi:DNA mismatch repair protein MutS2
LVRDDSVKRYQRKLANAKAQATSEIRRERQQIAPTETKAEEVLRSSSVPTEGSLVRVVSMGVTGSVTSINQNDAEILAGNIKLRRPISDLEVIERQAVKLPQGVHLSFTPRQLDKNEINVVGCKVDEALDRTDKFLDDAFLAQMSEVRIVHGSGTGALRHAISELLKSHPHVARFSAAPPKEGGQGVTLVTLRD